MQSAAMADSTRSLANCTFSHEVKRPNDPIPLVTGSDYSHPLATLGEVVLGKFPTTKSKAQRRWVKGLWLGKLDRDDSHILGTSSGAIAVRSVRRLPPESQTDGVMMKAMKGIPWHQEMV